MPEAPDLYVLREYLAPRIVGETITSATVLRPLVVRNMVDAPFDEHLAGRNIEDLGRKGKLMVMRLSDAHSLVISPMLTGEISLVEPTARLLKSTVVNMELSGGKNLRYIDRKRMGQVYYLPSDQVGEITRVADQGPDVLDEPLSIVDFKSNLKRFRGEVKGVLTRGELVAGIGNAYADEVLWSAGIYPFRKVPRLKPNDIERLHDATYRVPRDAVATLRDVYDGRHPRKDRKFLAVHGKPGADCPRCGTAVSSVKSRQRDTNFCRKCQPGTMFE